MERLAGVPSAVYRFPIIAATDMTNMIPSATGTASHTPVIPQIWGNSRMPPADRPNVRRKERAADTFPFDSAVNIAEVKMFKPQNRKL